MCKKDLMMEVMKMSADDDGLKAQGKMLNKVLAFCMAAAEKRGRSALAHRMPFDEEATLQEFRIYLAAELQLKNGIEIIIDSQEDVAGNSEPGVPVLIEF